MRRLSFLLLLLSSLMPAADALGEPVRIKDLGKVNSWRETGLVGYGLVTGLAGTGDSSRSKAARQSLANILSRFDLAIASDDIQSRNVAAVMITANLSSDARSGDVVDVSVSSIGDARSLAGGNLLTAPLKGPDGRVYVIAQGALTVGGYRYDANNNLVQKNHPTVGLVSGGGSVEVGLASNEPSQTADVTFVLQNADYTTAGRVADAINASFGPDAAEVRDAAGIDIHVPVSYQQRLPAFMRRLESLSVEPDLRARVVINERTGTVVSGGGARISPVSVSHGDLKLTVSADNSVSQPFLVSGTGNSVRTELITNSKMDVQDREGAKFVPPGATTVADLVQALVRMKTSTRDVIAVLQAVKAAGALHAELIVQ